jgi:hypothetical protein
LSAVDEPLATAWQRFCGDLDFVEVHYGSILDVSCDATQTKQSSGSVTLATQKVVKRSTKETPDDPTFGINRNMNGRLDWLDEPGWPRVQFGAQVVTADLTQHFVSTVTNRNTKKSCGVSWSLKFTLGNGKWDYTYVNH